jgi:preprotein translocase subunit SecD
MRHAALAICFSLACGVTATPRVSCQSVLEIRPVVDSLERGALKIVDEQSHRSVFVGGKAFFSISDVDSAGVYSGSEADGTPLFGVSIVFRQSLDDSMRSLTGHHVGSRLAIIVDGELLATPKILDPLQAARIGLYFATEAEAASIAKRITGALKRTDTRN